MASRFDGRRKRLALCQHFQKLLFGREKRLGVLQIIDIDGLAVPSGQLSGFIEIGFRAKPEPAIYTIVPFKAGTRLTRHSTGQGDLPVSSESSLIVDLFTRDAGRVVVAAKGA